MVTLEYDGKTVPATAGRVDAIMKDGRTARRLLSGERTAEKARERSAKLRSINEARDEREYGQQKRKILRELGLHHDSKAWGRTFHVKVEKASKRTKRKSERTIKPTKLRLGIRKYKAAIRDGRGRIAVFVRMRYLGQKSKGYRSGLAADHVKYIFREDGLEDPDIQLAEPMSNVAKSVEECAAFWNALEPIEEGYRANSKIQFRMTVALPYFFDAEQRRRVTQAIGDQVFGRVGLGWMAANHLPDAKGSQRNFHPHFSASMRPAERIGDHEWAFTEEKLTEPFTPEGLLRMRADIAAIINLECRCAGFEERYTHQSYQRRGINAVSTEHVGPERMALHDKGEPVGVVERNNARIEANEHSVEAQYLSKKVAILERLVGLAKEATVRARSSAGVQILKDAVAHTRNSVETFAALKNPKGIRRAISDAREWFDPVRAGAKKLRPANPVKVMNVSTHAALVTVLTTAQKASQADARRSRKLNLFALSQMAAAPADHQRARAAQPRRMSALAGEALTRIVKRTVELRNTIPAQTVQPMTSQKLNEILRSARAFRAPIQVTAALRSDTLAHLARIRIEATAIQHAEQPKVLASVSSASLSRIMASEKSTSRQAPVQQLASLAITSLTAIASGRAVLSSRAKPGKIDREAVIGMASMQREARALNSNTARPVQDYKSELELLHRIRATVSRRMAAKPAQPASSGLQPHQLKAAASGSIASNTPSSTFARENQQRTAPQTVTQTGIASPVRTTAEVSGLDDGIVRNADAASSGPKIVQPGGAASAIVGPGADANAVLSGSNEPTRTRPAEVPAPGATSSLDNNNPTSRMRDAPAGLGPQHVVDLLDGERFAVEEAHRGFYVPLTPVIAKHGMHEGAILHPIVQAALAARLGRQRQDQRVLQPLLARYVHEQDISDDDKIIGRMPDGEHRRLVEHWRGTGLLQMMLTRMRDDQKRQTEKLYRRWRKARDEGSPDRARCAGVAHAQQQRWPIELPQEHQKAMEQDAVLHRQRLRQHRAWQQGMGL